MNLNSYIIFNYYIKFDSNNFSREYYSAFLFSLLSEGTGISNIHIPLKYIVNSTKNMFLECLQSNKFCKSRLKALETKYHELKSSSIRSTGWWYDLVYEETG